MHMHYPTLLTVLNLLLLGNRAAVGGAREEAVAPLAGHIEGRILYLGAMVTVLCVPGVCRRGEKAAGPFGFS